MKRDTHTMGTTVAHTGAAEGTRQQLAGKRGAAMRFLLALAAVLTLALPAPAARAQTAPDTIPAADDALGGLWYDVGLECAFCLTLDNQTLQLGQVSALFKYSDRLELSPSAKSGKTINRTQGTETLTRTLKYHFQVKRNQIVLIQYVEGDGDRASDLFARIWVLSPMANARILYGRRYQVNAFTEDAFEPKTKGYRAREKFLSPERILTILEDVRVYSLNEQRKTYQPSEQARIQLEGAVAYVREGIEERDVVMAKQEAAARTQERTSREALFRTLVQQGDQAYASERYDDALNQYKAASAILPELALVHADLGAVYQVQNKLPEAEAAYRLCLELDPTDIDSLFNLAMVLEQSDRLTDALELYKTVVEKRPQDSDARDRLNKITLKLKR